MFSSGDMGEEKITFVRCLDPEKGERKKMLKEIFSRERYSTWKKKRMADNINHS